MPSHYDKKSRKKAVVIKTMAEQMEENRIKKGGHVDPLEAAQFEESFKSSFGFKKKNKKEEDEDE